jgi:uncharacterized membrane protein
MGLVGIEIDQRIGTDARQLPLGLTSTVASARAVLSTVAGATITVAGIAFSVSLLTIQLASSQYSPRVVSGLFRDPFNKRVIGVVVGTFSYCLVVLRSVRTALEQQGSPVIPNVSVGVGVLLGIASVLAIIAFINHNAHAMDISEILDGVTSNAIDAVDRHWASADHDETPAAGDSQAAVDETGPDSGGRSITFDRNGWVQLLDHDALFAVVPEGGTMRLETAVGRYAVVGTPLCTIWPEPEDPDRATRDARSAVHVGRTRTLQQDAAYGIRQLVDVGLKALSPGVNDPTTAQDAIFHLTAVLHAMLEREPPARRLRSEGRTVLLTEADRHEELISLSYDELRLASQQQPTVCIYLLESLALLRSADRPLPAAVDDALCRQAALVLEGIERSELGVADRLRVRHVYRSNFGT